MTEYEEGFGSGLRLGIIMGVLIASASALLYILLSQ